MRTITCLALLLSVAASLAADSPATDARKVDAPAADAPIRVACVGDSITFGSGIENREKNAYPAVLGRLLGEGYDVRNFGVSGATLQKTGDKPYWILDAYKDVALFKPHVIVIKLGTNDSKPQNWRDSKLFAVDLQALVTQLRESPEKPQVFLCTPAPVHKDAFGIREEIVRDQIVPVVKDVAKRTKTPLIDLHAVLKDDGDKFPDGVHPNAAGAKLIADSVAKAIREHSSKEHSSQ